MTGACTCAGTAPGYPQHESWCGRPEDDDLEAWDCGSGRCDPNTGCPECNDDRDIWVRRS